MSGLRPEVGVVAKTQIVLTPQMQLALQVLQAPVGELRQILDEAWTGNPFLEAAPAGGKPPGERARDWRGGGAGPADARPGGMAAGPRGGGECGPARGRPSESFGEVATRRGGWEDTRWAERLPDERESWQAALLAQYRLEERKPERVGIAEFILGCLDPRGYLGVAVADLAGALGVAAELVEEVRQKLMRLDPPGVGARSPGECLGVQLAQAGRGGSLAARIVEEDLELLARRRLTEIASRRGVGLEAVRRAVREIRGLRPYPAGPLQHDGAEPLIPDIVVVQAGAEFEVLINDRTLPELRVVPPGAAMLHAAGPAARAFVAEHLARARWLLGSLDARRRTLVVLMRRIIEEQRGFFEEGVEGLRPLGYRRMAGLLGLHESTIARAVRGKVVETPRGLFPLRFFFTYGLSAERGEDWTPAAVAGRIRALIEAEKEGRPLSDEAIMQRLRQEGVRIARRTVAKYRDRLGIPRAMYRGQF